MSIRQRIKTEQVNLRLSPEELDLIRRAAKKRGVTVTELILSATLDKIQAGSFKGTLRRMVERGEV